MSGETSRFKNRNEMLRRFLQIKLPLSAQEAISRYFEKLDESMKEDLAREVVKVLDAYEKPADIIGGCKAADAMLWNRR